MLSVSTKVGAVRKGTLASFSFTSSCLNGSQSNTIIMLNNTRLGNSKFASPATESNTSTFLTTSKFSSIQQAGSVFSEFNSPPSNLPSYSRSSPLCTAAMMTDEMLMRKTRSMSSAVSKDLSLLITKDFGKVNHGLLDLESVLRDVAEAAREASPSSHSELLNSPKFLSLLSCLNEKLSDGNIPQIIKIASYLSTIRKDTLNSSNPVGGLIRDIGLQITSLVCNSNSILSASQLAQIIKAHGRLRIRNIQFAEFARLGIEKCTPTATVDECFEFLRALQNTKSNVHEKHALVSRIIEQGPQCNYDEIIKIIWRFIGMNIWRPGFFKQVREQLVDNPQELTLGRRLQVMRTFARLRMLKFGQIKLLLTNNDPQVKPASMAGWVISEAFNAMSLIGYSNMGTVMSYLENKNVQSLEGMTPEQCLSIAHGICFYDVQEQKSLLNASLMKALSGLTPETESSSLVKLHEVSASLDLDFKLVQAKIPGSLANAARDAHQKEVLQAPDLAVIQRLLGESRLRLQCEKNQPVGPYNVQLLDVKQKTIFELDSIRNTTSRHLQHRHLRMLGYKTVIVPFGDFKFPRDDAAKLSCLEKSAAAPKLELVYSPAERGEKEQRKGHVRA